jgi:glycosyltransferase involved in cell wall biosynthesis
MTELNNDDLRGLAAKSEMTSPLAARQTAPGISVFFPAYNDAGTIASMVLAALHTCNRLTDDYEVVVVENGSTDYTVEVVEDLMRMHAHLKLLSHKEPLGYGGALRLGFETASKELVFYTDGDAQYDAHELSLLYAALRPEVDIVQGYKISRSDPLFRIIIGRTYHWIVKIAFGLPIRDTDCDFRLIRKSALERFTLKSTTGTIPLELVKKLHDSGAVFAEVPVHHYHRVYGRSQFFNFKRLWATGIQLLQLWKELVVVPAITKRKPVISVKQPVKAETGNPSLVYQTDMQSRSMATDDRRPMTDDRTLGGVNPNQSVIPNPQSAMTRDDGGSQ